MIIDTPGFFDDYQTSVNTFKHLSRLCTLARDGLHAVAFVISLKQRFTVLHSDLMNKLLQSKFKAIDPYIFLLFTHAGENGITEPEANQYVEQKILKHPSCSENFKKFMEMVHNRVLMVESCNSVSTVVNYKEQKCKELLRMIGKVSKNGTSKYTNLALEYTAKVYMKQEQKQGAKIKERLHTIKVKKDRLLSQDTENASQDEPLLSKTKKLEDEIHALETELFDVLEKAHISTAEIVEDAMNKNKNYWLQGNVEDFYKELVFTLKVAILVSVVGGGIGGVAGAIIGGVAGSVVPGAGTAAGAATGAGIGTVVGSAAGYLTGTVFMFLRKKDNASNNDVRDLQ